MRKIKAIIKRADEPVGHVAWISPTLENLQKHVGDYKKQTGGFIEKVKVRKDMVVLCNKEGMILGLPKNVRVYRYYFVGDIVILGVDGDEFTDVPITFSEYKEIIAEF